MKLLILSLTIWRKQHDDESFTYRPPSDVQLEVGCVDDLSKTSIFDYDVSIVHFNSNYGGICDFLPKLLEDSQLALANGRSIICFPGCDNDCSYKIVRESTAFGPRYYEKRVEGQRLYHWLEELSITLQDSGGTSIVSSGTGKALAIEQYLQCAPKYYQIIVEPKCDVKSRLAVVEGTEIVVGLEIKVGKGTLVVLPPPDFGVSKDDYVLRMSSIIELARRYYERAQRAVPVGDAPAWLNSYLVKKARSLHEQIERLSDEKAKYDQIAYGLYGTGDELEGSVELLLKDLGLEVEPQSPGANIDQKARHKAMKLGFAIEITGTKDIVKKDSTKIGQAWTYLNDCAGTLEESNKLIIIANTQCHLDPKERKRAPFSSEVVKLLEKHGVLLMTTVQLYELWRKVHDKELSSDDVVKELSSKSGVYSF